MPSLYFLGLRKSWWKKRWPFSWYFFKRDLRCFETKLSDIKRRFEVQRVNNGEYEITVIENGKTVKVLARAFPSSDMFVFHQVFLQQHYIRCVKLRSPKQNQGPTIIDAGANVGYSVIFFKLYFPDSKILAIEPDKENFTRLSLNINRNQVTGVTLLRGALWPLSSYLTTKRNFRDNSESAITVEPTANVAEVKGYPFDSLLKLNSWHNVWLTKIDIEGGEQFLFDTAINADSILQRTEILAIEIHDEFKVRDKIYNHLKRHSFIIEEDFDLTIASKTVSD